MTELIAWAIENSVAIGVILMVIALGDWWLSRHPETTERLIDRVLR